MMLAPLLMRSRHTRSPAGWHVSRYAEMRTDKMSRFHNALYLGDVPDRITLLQALSAPTPRL